MFLNNAPIRTASFQTNNNENIIQQRSKPLNNNSENVVSNNTMKKTSFNNENSMKTPHRNKDKLLDGGAAATTQQRRRRALGDISNRKGGGLAGNGATGKSGAGKVVVGLKQNKAILFATPSAKPRNMQQQQQLNPPRTANKTPSNSTTIKPRLVGGGTIPTNRPKTAKSSEYDGVFGVTTRWSEEVNTFDRDRSPFDFIPREEVEMVDTIRREMIENDKKQRLEKLVKEERAFQEELLEQYCLVDENGDDGLAEVFDRCDLNGNDEKEDNEEDDTALWNALDRSNSWEDGVFDPAEERRLCGSDPLSMWGDF
ncbi:predicted protein [Thalassiosira pseudonana CCMP1335]|uniref:Uncharacterized protein n=1 Tax=Thalassiosira pseudonana TaxID=35128 RepID=B8BSB9_THAPS|nr:predicted protein [Thalassiosira pseudonana CCMP1335]EED96101.1 predicted protein [Thalassiosira pseudonana CCMP1335]|eukprot:scaffold358_cov207-Alexandrium_tamarense.AAC.21